MLILSDADVRRALPMAAAIEGMKVAYAQVSAGEADMPLRARVGVPSEDAVALFMPAYMRGSGDLAVKTVTVFPRNVQQGDPMIYASVLVLDATTGRPLALLEGGSLTAIRTGAGGGASADLLARPDARVLALLGSGVQARAGLEAVCTVRSIEAVRIYSPNADRAGALAAEMAGVGPIPADVRAVADPAAAVHDADIVYTATTSATPTFDGHDLKPGAHVVGVGSYTPQMQEVDAVTVRRASVFVDAAASVWEEAGDLIVPHAAGELDRDAVIELGSVVLGRHPGRRSADEITFFKSVGVAAQDAVAARIALNSARAHGLGTDVPLLTGHG